MLLDFTLLIDLLINLLTTVKRFLETEVLFLFMNLIRVYRQLRHHYISLNKIILSNLSVA